MRPTTRQHMNGGWVCHAPGVARPWHARSNFPFQAGRLRSQSSTSSRAGGAADFFQRAFMTCWLTQPLTPKLTEGVERRSTAARAVSKSSTAEVLSCVDRPPSALLWFDRSTGFQICRGCRSAAPLQGCCSTPMVRWKAPGQKFQPLRDTSSADLRHTEEQYATQPSEQGYAETTSRSQTMAGWVRLSPQSNHDKVRSRCRR